MRWMEPPPKKPRRSTRVSVPSADSMRVQRSARNSRSSPAYDFANAAETPTRSQPSGSRLSMNTAMRRVMLVHAAPEVAGGCQEDTGIPGPGPAGGPRSSPDSKSCYELLMHAIRDLAPPVLQSSSTRAPCDIPHVGPVSPPADLEDV